MKISDAVASRHSVRAFLDRPVAESTIRRVIERASRAPSGGNLQPWHVDILAGAPLEAVKAAVAGAIEADGLFGQTPEYAIYPSDLPAPYEDRRVAVGEAMYTRLGIPREDRAARRAWFAANFRFFDAPVGLFCSVDRRMGPPQWSDLGMFLQTVMLLLREEELHSCAQECWAMFPDSVARCIGLPAERMLFAGMAIGHADPDAQVNRLVSARADVDDFARFTGFPMDAA